MTRTIVIGAGIGGLATAALLAREGHDVRLLEKNARVGGRAGVLERDGFRFDTGPSWYLMPRVFDHFFELLGTTTEAELDLELLDPGYRVFSEPDATGRSHEITIPHGEQAVAQVFEELEPGSGERLRRYLRSARHASLMAERYFLYNPFTRPHTLAAPDVLAALPKLASLLGVSLERFVARRFRHPLIRQMLGYPAVFLGTEPRRAPSMYHLMSALDLDEGVQYPMGGFWRLVERLAALAEDAGVEIITDAEVSAIFTRPAGRKQRVTAVEWRDREGNHHVDSANIVVSGADLHHTETKLLAPEARSFPPSWWDKLESGPGAVLVLLGVKGELPQLEHHSLFFTHDWHANFRAIFGDDPRVPEPASIYVCKPSATDDDVAPDGHENLFVLIPVPPDPGIGKGCPDGGGSPTVERAADAAIDQIAAWAGIDDLRERIVVRHTIGPADFADDYHSWRGGMLGPSHILRQSAMMRAQNQSRRVEDLYYAGATTAPGVGVPMCLISAELVLKRIRGDHSAGPTKPRVRPVVRGRR